MTLPAVIIAPERNQNIGVFYCILNCCRTTIVHFVRELIRIPKRGCHLDIRLTVWVIAELFLQGVVDCARVGFLSLHEVDEHDAVVGVGSEARIFGKIIRIWCRGRSRSVPSIPLCSKIVANFWRIAF